MKTAVQFMYHITNDDLYAMFPGIKETNGFLGYSHIGQHSEICQEYINESRIATIDEYSELQAELESIGYDLTILNESLPICNISLADLWLEYFNNFLLDETFAEYYQIPRDHMIDILKKGKEAHYHSIQVED